MSELEWALASPSPSPSPSPICDYSEWRATRVLIPAVYLLTFSAGALGNALVLWVYLHPNLRCRARGLELPQESCRSPSPARRSLTEGLIASLAGADLAFVTTLPLWAAYTALDYHWPFGGVLCRVSSFLVALNMYASVFSLTGLSVERYRAIARRTAVPRHATHRLIGVVWVAAFILALPALLLRTVREVPAEAEPGSTRCLCDTDYSSVVSSLLDPAAREQAELMWAAALGLTSTLLGFLLPLAVLLLCYCSLGRIITQHFSVGPRPDRTCHRRLLRVIASLVLAFVLCWLPFHTNKTLSALVELELLPYSCNFDRWLVGIHPYAICLGYTNSCLNPLLYACCDLAFRRRCRKLARSFCRRKPIHEETQDEMERQNSGTQHPERV